MKPWLWFLLVSSVLRAEIAFPVQLPRLPSGGATTGACLVRGATSWSPALCFTGASQSFSSATIVTFTHNLNTTALKIVIVDASGNRVRPRSATIVDANTVQATFDTPSTGRLIVK